jgi:hypothetical protein
MAKLFEYAIYKDEKKDKDGEITDPAAVLVYPVCIMAKDEAQCAMIAARSLTDADMADIDRIQVVVRPF